MKKSPYFTPASIEKVAQEMQKKLEDYGLGKFREFATDAIALIVLDMQNYFLLEESNAFIPSAKSIVTNINKLIKIFNRNNFPVIFTKHSNNEENARQMAVRWKHLTPESGVFNEIYDKIDSTKGIFINKNQYDAFFCTNLLNILQERKIKQVIITGVITNLCVETTARSSFVNGFHTIVPIDTTATYNLDLHLSSFINLSFSINSTPLSSELINYLENNI